MRFAVIYKIKAGPTNYDSGCWWDTKGEPGYTLYQAILLYLLRKSQKDKMYNVKIVRHEPFEEE